MSWLIFDKILRMGVGLIVGVWVARYLGPTQFGLFSFATAFVGMYGAIAGLGLQNIVVRDILSNPNHKEETLGTAFLLQVFGGMLSYACLIGSIFYLRPEDIQAQLLVAIIGSVILFKFSEVGLYWFESQVQSKYTVWVQNGCFVIFAAIKTGLILTNASMQAFAWAVAAEALIVAVLTLVVLNLRGPKLQQLIFTWQRVKTLLIDSWPLLLSGLAVALYMKIDQIMLGQILGDEAVGLYSAAVRISEVFYFIPMVISSSVFPSILEVKTRNIKIYQQRMQLLYDFMVWISVVIALPMTFISIPMVVMLFGSAYTESGLVLAIHIWTSVFVFLGVASGQWIIAENRQILNFQRTFLGLIVNILLNFILIPKFGVVGAAIATLLGQMTASWLFDFIQSETRPVFIAKSKAFNLIRSYKNLINQLNLQDKLI